MTQNTFSRNTNLQTNLIHTATNVLAKFLLLPNNPKPERTGGYLSVVEVTPDQKKNLLITEIGKCPPDMLRTFDIVQEKTCRLHEHLSQGHISSWESRDFDNRKYGGAIITPTDSIILEDPSLRKMGGFSGLIEHGDEAVTIVTWMILRWLDYTEAMRLAEISKNDHLLPLMQACNNLF